jgi:hypothetical protein
MNDFDEISLDEFWNGVNELPPLLRLGYSDGPGAFICSEPWTLRQCAVTGQQDYTYCVYVALKTGDGVPTYFRHRDRLTIHEFKALASRIMPGVGICGMLWGSWLLDEPGDLRSDLKFPVRITDREWRYRNP